MSSSRNWSHDSFEKVVKEFAPFVKLWWMEYIKIIPVNYSEWSDRIYVIVEFEMTKEGIEMASGWSPREQREVTELITEYIKRYFSGYLNTNVEIEEFRRPANYTLS